MRKIAIAGVVAALTFTVGCQRSGTAEDVQAQREDVLEQREELAQTRAEEQQRLEEERAEATQEYREEVAGLEQDTQEEIQSEREELAQQREELAEARTERQEELAEQRQEGEAIGGAGEAGVATSLSGTVESKKADKLTLKTDEGSRELIVTTDTDFVHMGRDIQIQDVPEGAQVRASYSLEANKMVADRVEVIDAAK